MTTLFIGQLHNCGDNDRDMFDMCYPAKTELEIIKTIQLETLGRLIDQDAMDDLDSLRELLNCTTKEELSNWFDEHMAYYSFSIQECDLK